MDEREELRAEPLSSAPFFSFLDPCDDNDDCQWGDYQALYMTTRRWYPTLETLEDGSAIIVSRFASFLPPGFPLS